MDDTSKTGISVEQPSSPRRTATIGWAILAIATQVALVDSAVETFRDDSAIGWWVAAPVLVFVALSVWLWRPGGTVAKRWGWSGAAAWSIGGLFLLLAVTVWLPEGQVNGVRMALQPTSTVLTAAIALAVLLAAYVLARGLAFLPKTAQLLTRAVFITLALYALVALGLAIAERAPYAALFQGGAAWPRLPRWLQGTFIGALVLLPLAIVVQIARFAETLRRQQPVRLLVHQATALVMAFVMAVSGVVLPRAGAGVAPSASTALEGATATPSAGTAREGAAPVVSFEQWRKQSPFALGDPVKSGEQFFQAAEAELARPGADPSDVEAKAAALGPDAETIFGFLRDQVTLEPYSGMLRGARGTLAAGAGNALDRALLGQALLKASGTESRLVSGRLSGDQAETLLHRYLATSPVSGPLASAVYQPGDASLRAAGQDLSAKAGLPPEQVDRVLRRAGARAEAFWSITDEQRASQFEFLADQLRRGGVKPPPDRAAVAAKLRDRLKEHYWLQVKESGDTWSEFDPSFADARRGTAYASGPIALPGVPADRTHRFEFSLVYRTRVGRAPKQETLVTGTFASADVLFAPMEFRIQPGEAIADTNALLAMDAAQKIEMLRNIKRFQGLLRVRSKVIVGRPFDLEGHTYDAESAAPSSKSAGDLLGGLFGGEEAGTAPGEFVDLQVALRLSGPGRVPMTQTRTLVRAADLKAPTFAPPLMEWEILVQPQWISTDLAAFQILSGLLPVQKALTETLRGGQAGKPSPPPPPVPQQLLQLALLRESAAAGILATQPGVRALVDQPMLTLAGHRLAALRPQEGRIDVQRTIDIVENAVSFVAKDQKSQEATFDVAVRQGVADCTLEHRFLQDAFPQTRAESGVTVFQRAQLERRPILLAGPGEPDTLRNAGLVEADVEWIRANESPDNRLVIAKASTGAAAWWSVRPDGNAVLRVSGGQGQAHAEHEIDIMLISLKIMFALVCGLEVAKGAKGEPSGMAGWKLAFCAAAAGSSMGFVIAGAHTASWVLICIEVLELIAAAIAESGEGHGE